MMLTLKPFALNRGFTLIELVTLITVSSIVATALFMALIYTHSKPLVDYPTVLRAASNALEIAKSRILINGSCGAEACVDGPPYVNGLSVDCDPTQPQTNAAFCRISMGNHIRYTISMSATSNTLSLSGFLSIPVWDITAQVQVYQSQNPSGSPNWELVATTNLQTYLVQP